MEANYFKTGRDSGPRSLRSRVSKQSRSKSEKDSSPRSKRDRLRKKRSLRNEPNKADSPSDLHSQNLKNFSKILREEEVKAKIENLKRIDEVDEEEDVQDDVYAQPRNNRQRKNLASGGSQGAGNMGTTIRSDNGFNQNPDEMSQTMYNSQN